MFRFQFNILITNKLNTKLDHYIDTCIVTLNLFLYLIFFFLNTLNFIINLNNEK